MTCPLSPFAAAQGEPTAPQDGQSHPDGKGMHSNVLCVQPLCSFLCISLGDPLYRFHGSAKVGSTCVSYPGLNSVPFTWRHCYCITMHLYTICHDLMHQLVCCEHVQNCIQSLVVCFSLFSLYCGCMEGTNHVNRHYCPGTLSPLSRFHLLRFITSQ